MSFDLSQVQAAVVETAKDLTKATKGGGGTFKPLVEGICNLRLVGYIESGEHEYESNVPGKGKVPKCTPHAHLIFEVSGPKHPPREIGEGENKKTVPNLLAVKFKNVSTNSKADYFKAFNAMNHGGTDTHFVQLLGKAFRGKVEHWTPPGSTNVIAMLENLGPPTYEHPETGDLVVVNPPPVTTPLRLFVWNTPVGPILQQMWDSLFIDGTYTDGDGDDAREVSLNKWQELIGSAKNFEGSSIESLLATNGQGLAIKARPKLEAAEPATAEAPADSDDPLNGM